MLYTSRLSRFFTAVTLTGLAAASCAEENFRQAQDMRYGAVLYEYFQGNNFEALTHLMIAEDRGGIQVHADNAALIEGGISLGFGLHQRAADLFNQQLQHQQGDPRALARYREIAWLKLAELNYLQQAFERSAEQLAFSGAEAKSDLALNLALQLNQLEQAEQLLAGKGPALASLPLEQRVLGHINLAAAYARAQAFDAAARHYRRGSALVEQESEPGSELLILRDKAHIGRGFVLSLQGQHTEAVDAFRGVRLDTPWSERALLGLGSAAISDGNFAVAVDALHYLIEQNPLAPAVQQALMALPYSYEQLNRPGTALAGYQRAEASYRVTLQQLADLDQQVAAARFDQQAQSGQQRYGWLQAADAPQPLKDGDRYLHRLLNSDRFQLRLSDLRDLHQLGQVLDRWEARTPLFGQLIDERAQRHQNIVASYTSAQYDQQVDLAQRQFEQLRDGLEAIETNRDALALMRNRQASEEEEEGQALAELLVLQERATATMEKLEGSGKVRPYQRTLLERARGLLAWEASQQYHQNLWQQQKSLQALEKSLNKALSQQRQVDRIAQQAPELGVLRGRVQDALPRLRAQQETITRASAAIEASIRRDLRAQLATERARVEQFSAYARLAIARLQDAASTSPAPVPTVADTTETNTGVATQEGMP